MIDKRNNSYDINIEVDIPNNDDQIVNALYEDLQEIQDKYIGLPTNESIIHAMEYDLRKLLEKPLYWGVRIKNNEFFNVEEWDLNKILTEYRKYYPERYDETKKEYTNIEVNNILFELDIANVIGGYECVAVPFDLPSHNDKLFDKSIRVHVPVINLGSQEAYDPYQHELHRCCSIDEDIIERILDNERELGE